MRAIYRIGQGIRALFAGLRAVDDTRATAHLSPALFALYRKMRRSERQHSLRVLADLQAQGHTDPDLLAAALLHDVGKSRARFTIVEKTLVVLVKAWDPARYLAWGSGPAQGWRLPFAVSVQHAAWGADMVAAAGGSPELVALILHHQDDLTSDSAHQADWRLPVLQTADARN